LAAPAGVVDEVDVAVSVAEVGPAALACNLLSYFVHFFDLRRNKGDVPLLGVVVPLF